MQTLRCTIGFFFYFRGHKNNALRNYVTSACKGLYKVFPLLVYRFKDSILICYQRLGERVIERENLGDNNVHSSNLFANFGSFQREITSTNRIENKQLKLQMATMISMNYDFWKLFISVPKKILKHNLRHRKNRKKNERTTPASVNNTDIPKINTSKPDSNMYPKGSELVVYLLLEVILQYELQDLLQWPSFGLLFSVVHIFVGIQSSSACLEQNYIIVVPYKKLTLLNIFYRRTEISPF